jgi:hypothetical protein
MSAALASNIVPLFDVPAADQGVVATAEQDELDLSKFRRDFSDYVTVKSAEIDEAREAWRYYSGDQWTREQLETLRKRKQPPITFNLVDIMCDGSVGVLAQTRGDPKAYPRTPDSEEAAEVATESIRAVLDGSNWEADETEAIRQAYVGGIAVAQLEFVEGDNQDDDIIVSRIDPTTFFYDPRSIEADFSDARFMGVSKWCTPDDIDEMFPGTADDIQDCLDGGEMTAFDSDRDALWVQGRTRIRLVEHWYKKGGVWRYVFYAGNVQLAAGVSPHMDERGKPICRFFAFVNRIDQDGDHHGFVRRMKGPQDAINQHRSKALHIMNTRQIKMRRGASSAEIDEARREAARPDGVLLWDNTPDEVEVNQPATEFLQQTQYYSDAKAMMEQFGPTQAALHGDKSGRAVAMIMQAGMAQLGPFVTNLRNWRLRIYKAIWAQVKNTWTNERIIRVTADQEAPKFLAVNQVQRDPATGMPAIDPRTGQPAIVNALSTMNVDIILDEGPNSVNVMSDVFDLLGTLAQNKVPVPPAALIEASSLPGSVKKKLIGIMTAPNPLQDAAGQTKIENMQADTRHKLASAEHQTALARREHVGTHLDAVDTVVNAQPDLPQLPPPQPLPVQPGF